MEKDKKIKKRSVFPQDLLKKIDINFKGGRKKEVFNIEKKKPFKYKGSDNNKGPKQFSSLAPKKNFTRKFVEQQATKEFIKKDNKPAGKSKLKLKNPLAKRDFKLTVSRALNVEEIEIKQRSLASVKRARLKEKKVSEDDEKKKLKKLRGTLRYLNKYLYKNFLTEWQKNLVM